MLVRRHSKYESHSTWNNNNTFLILRLPRKWNNISKNMATRYSCLPGKKWNESGFRPTLCTYRLKWARRTSWGWWDDWEFEPWRSEAEHATSRSLRLPTILTFTRGWGRNIFVSFKPPRPGTEPGTVLTTTLGPPPCRPGVNGCTPALRTHETSHIKHDFTLRIRIEIRIGLRTITTEREWLNSSGQSIISKL